MAYVIVNEFEGGTREQYDATTAVVHPPGGLPAGQTHHYAGLSASGWVVVAVWEEGDLGAVPRRDAAARLRGRWPAAARPADDGGVRGRNRDLGGIRRAAREAGENRPGAVTYLKSADHTLRGENGGSRLV